MSPDPRESQIAFMETDMETTIWETAGAIVVEECFRQLSMKITLQ